MQAIVNIIIDYVDYNNMINFIVAMMTSKSITIPKYRMTQLKNKFLEKRETKYGFYYCYPNGVVEGEYQCTHDDVFYEGIFINNERYCKVSGAGYERAHDASCRDKPFACYVDKYTGHTNRIVCGELHGDINTVIENEAKFIRTHKIGKNTYKHVTVGNDKIVVVDYPPSKARMICGYDINGAIRGVYEGDEAYSWEIIVGDCHAEIILGYRHAYHVNLRICDKLCRTEFHSHKIANGQSDSIVMSSAKKAESRYYYDSKYDHYINKRGEILDEHKYTRRPVIDNIMRQNKLDPSFIPTKEILDVLKKRRIF
jgi:hypothetical protein